MNIICSGIAVERSKTDILVIGAGGAGVRAAVEAARTNLRVTITSYLPLGRGGLTPTANGGYHAAMLPGDSPAVHADDLISMGRYLNDRNLVKVLTEEALQEARELEKYGAKINWNMRSKPSEPEMSYPRSVMIPGKEIMSSLGKHLKKLSNVQILEDHLAIKLLVGAEGVCGAVFFNVRDRKVLVCESKATILATGSMGEVYPLTAQEPMGISTYSSGSGYVLAGLAGAHLVDMEMIQFTIMPVNPPIIKGLRSLSWVPLRNSEGREFLPPNLGPYSHQAAQMVWKEIAEGRGPIYMQRLDGQGPMHNDRSSLGRLRNEILQRFEATIYQRSIEIGLGVLFMMGGVHINDCCETSVARLYAAGEVSGNVHGARRVSGNALPEIIVFGARAGRNAAQAALKEGAAPQAPWEQVEECLMYIENMFQKGTENCSPKEIRDKVRSIMGAKVHAIRNRQGLQKALDELSELEKEVAAMKIANDGRVKYDFRIGARFEVNWLLHTAQVICRAALLREESRGFHFREDFPEEREEWLQHTKVQWDGKEWIAAAKPVTV